MKLKNKLMPLVGLSAVCATAIPLASCANSKDAFVDLKQRYTPEEQLDEETTFANIDAANSKYFSDTNFAKHFVQDYYYSTAEENYIINNSDATLGEGQGKDGSAEEAGKPAEEWVVTDEAAPDVEGQLLRNSSNSMELSKPLIPKQKAPLDSFGYIFTASVGDKILVNTEIMQDNERLSNVSVDSKSKLAIKDGEGSKSVRVYYVSYKLEYDLKLTSEVFNISTNERVTAERTVKGTVEVKNLPMTLAYGPYTAFGTDANQFYLKIDEDLVSARQAILTEDEVMFPDHDVVANQVTHTETVAVSSTQGTKTEKKDTDITVGYKADGTVVGTAEEIEAYAYDTLTTANQFASWYMLSCSILND